jgi:hypothetical protein
MALPAPLRSIALAIGVVAIFSPFPSTRARASEAPCLADEYVTQDAVCVTSDTPSWIFSRGTYTHDPYTGARVAQYMRTPPVEPLEDQRFVTSRYRRSRTNLRGANGSFDTHYEIQAWGNGRGGIDAEWERFHDAWKESILSGGYFNQGPAYGPWGHPGYGYGPGYGFPGGGFPGGNYPGYGPGHWQQPQGGWNHGYHGEGPRDDDSDD